VVLGLTRADAFGRIGAVSPSVWWANREILAEVGGLTAKLPLRIWVDMGTAEGSGAAVGDARALRDALVAKGWREGDDLSYREYAGARHDEASWAARVGDVLRYLFPVR
jgi:predicted alpha/beta superfamily hydrolase